MSEVRETRKMAPSSIRTHGMRALFCSSSIILCVTLAHSQAALPHTNVVPNPPDTTDGAYGSSVSVLGNRIAVGMPVYAPYVYIFEKSGSNWIQTERLFTPDWDPERTTGMGWQIVQDDHSLLTSDSVYGFVYYWEKTSPSAPFRSTAILHGGPHVAGFGGYIAMEGCWAMIGSGIPYTNQLGAVHVYNRCPDGRWTWKGSLYAPDGTPGNAFSNSIALSGNEMLVGAPQANNSSGAVYYYSYDGSQWVFKQKFLQTHGANGNRFGHSVSFQNGLAVIGAPGMPDVGQAQVFKRASSGKWTHLADIVPPATDGSWSGFARQVLVKSDRVLIAATPDQNWQGTQNGKLFIYKRTGDTLTPERQLISDTNRHDGGFATSFDVSGRTLIIGEPRADLIQGYDYGRATVYTLPAP
jgi:hypothetical protein